MSNIDASVLRRFEKVLALAKDGVAGERVAAQSQIEKMLAKYGIDLDIFCKAGAPERYEVRYSGVLERRLLVQIAGTVLNTNDPEVYKPRKGNTILVFVMTPAQHAEVVVTFGAMKAALKKEMKRAFSAFLHVNMLFPQVQLDESPSGVPLTPEQRADNYRTRMMAQAMSRTQVHRALPNSHMERA